MRITNKRIRALGVLAAVAGATVVSASNVFAAPLDISDTPLFLTSGVEPNLIMAIDDSGSMDFEVLLRGNDGSAWWRTADDSGDCDDSTGRSFVGCVSNSTGTTDVEAPGQLNFNNAGIANSTWKKFSYLFPNGCNSANDSFQRRLCDSTNDHYAIPPIPAFAWARSPQYNKAYFNPNTRYEPWPDSGAFTFEDSDPVAARWDPVFADADDTINLTQDRAGGGSADTTVACGNSLPGTASNTYFRVFSGMTIPAGTCYRRSTSGAAWTLASSDITVGASGSPIPNNSSLAVRYFPATFYLSSAELLPEGFGYTGSTLTGSAPDGTTLYGYEIKPGNFASTEQYDAAIQNFANWFTYYRKRHQALRAGLGLAFTDITGIRVGGFTINNRSTVTMLDIDNAGNREDLYDNFYEDWVRSGGTPNRSAVAHMISTFRRTDSGAPVRYACQKNFGMLFTDGFSNPPSDDTGLNSYNHQDSTAGEPYQDAVPDTVADAAMYAYNTPLRTGTNFPAGKVPVPINCPNERLDCNNNLHMNFYAVTLGTRGLLFNPDADPPQDPYASPPTWPTTFPARHPSAVDDLWHATINGRGQLLNANSPDEIAQKLGDVLRAITDKQGSASSAALNSGSITSDTRLYQAMFDSSDWSGKLWAYPVLSDGTLILPDGAEEETPEEETPETPEVPEGGGASSDDEPWEASAELGDPDQREIITINSDGDPVAFAWDGTNSLDATRKAQLDPDAERALAILKYIRGDRSLESEPDAAGQEDAAIELRPRGSALGDIVNSSPIFVGAPKFGYRDSLEEDPYSVFRADNLDRTPAVYVGANDGMLHAFDATDGKELFAFIPSPVFQNLHLLADHDYSHRFYVDGSPNAGDVFIDDEWQTVLVGGLNAGGQGIYALNITDPGSVTEDSANDLVMWEFTDQDDADLGYTYAQPAIVRLSNGKWAAIFGNGYNNTEPDGAASSTGNAVLFIVDIETGDVIRKIDTMWGAEDDPLSMDRPNGLSTPSAVDLNGDAIVDFVFAGDLFGAMWKFDLRAEDPTQWKIAFEQSGEPMPFFEARDPNNASRPQPITSRPEVIRGPRGVGMMVLFGTGKYLESSDTVVSTADPEWQTFYGLFDRNAYASGVQNDANRVTSRSQLQQQTILREFALSVDGVDYALRMTSQNAMGAKGWYIHLVSPNGYQGERQVSNTLVRSGRVIFTTLIPSSDPCLSGGTSWLMELDALTGGRLEETPFDVNRDGEFSDADLQLLAESGTATGAVSGVKLDVGISPEPGVLISEDGTKEFKYNPGTSGGIGVTVENPGEGAAGRQSWRQIR